MPPISITFCTPSNSRFECFDSLKDITEEELTELAIYCRSATAAFSTELLSRRDPRKDQTLEDYRLLLSKTASQINRQGLTNEHDICLNSSYEYLAASDDARSEIQNVRQLLWLVSRLVDWSYALLLLCSLGKHKLQKLAEDQRVKLIKYIIHHRKSLFCPILKDKAVLYKLCQIRPPSIQSSKKRKGSDEEKSISDRRASAEYIFYSVELSDIRKHSKAPTKPKLSSLLNASRNPRPSIPLSSHEHQTMPSGSYPSSDTRYLSFLLHAMGGSKIPELLFDRASLPQRRWDASGREIQFTAGEAGLDQYLVDILTDTDRRKQAIRPFVKSELTNNGFETISLESNIRASQFLSDQTNQEKERWSVTAFKVICFVFPRDQCWELQPNFTFIVKLLLGPLKHILQTIEQTSVADYNTDETFDTLLAASKVGNSFSRQSMLTVATKFMKDRAPSYRQGEMALQQSILSRLVGDYTQSEQYIHNFCCGCSHRSMACLPQFYRSIQPEKVSNRVNALYGHLHGSHLENLVQCEQYTAAIEQVDDWKSSKLSSPLTARVLSSRAITTAKIFRSQGLFEDVRIRLDKCLEALSTRDIKRCQVLCSLADVYCDLKQPEKAYNLLAPELDQARNASSKTKPFRRFLTTIVETHIQRYNLTEAASIIAELRDAFNELSNMDVSDQLLHVRVLIASARICHFNKQFKEALREWEDVLTYIQTYKSFDGEGFTYAVVYLSISLASLKSGRTIEAYQAFERAAAIWSKGIRDYWVPNLADWGQQMMSTICSLTGWHVRQKSASTVT